MKSQKDTPEWIKQLARRSRPVRHTKSVDARQTADALSERARTWAAQDRVCDERANQERAAIRARMAHRAEVDVLLRLERYEERQRAQGTARRTQRAISIAHLLPALGSLADSYLTATND